jgi:hypothetical protein
VMPVLFAPESPRRMAAMRIGLGLILFLDAVVRWPYVVELYSRDGMPMPLYPGTFLEPYALGANACVFFYGLMLFVLLAVMVGWQTRLSLLAAFALTAWFGLLDSAGTFKKYSAISLHLLLFLSFSESAAILSVDSQFLESRRKWIRLTPAWPRRLMQFLIASVYLGAVITKIRLPDFGTGDLLMFSLLDDRWGGTWLGMWLSTQPRLLMLASYGTVLLELAGALLLWNSRTRLPMLVLLMLFHLSIMATMHVGIFSPVMIVALLAFSEESDVRLLKKIGNSIWKRKPDLEKTPREKILETSVLVSSKWKRELLNLGIFLLAAGICAGAGLVQKRSMDDTEVFSGNLKSEWEELSPSQVDEIQNLAPQKVADFFHRVEIGSRMGYRQTFGEKRKFRRGMTVFVVVRLQQNHPALELEWILTAPGGEEPFQRIQPLQPLVTYATTGFRMDSPSHQLGIYSLTLKANGETVARRSFELVAD